MKIYNYRQHALGLLITIYNLSSLQVCILCHLEQKTRITVALECNNYATISIISSHWTWNHYKVNHYTNLVGSFWASERELKSKMWELSLPKPEEHSYRR